MTRIVIFILSAILILTQLVFAEENILTCETLHRVKDGKKETMVKYIFKYALDLDKKYLRSIDSDSRTYLIILENELLQYELSPMIGGGFVANTKRLNRLNGIKTIYINIISVDEWKILKKSLDSINSKISGYKKNLDYGDEIYEVSLKGTLEQEMNKFKIIDEVAKKGNNIVFWECKKSKRII